MSDSTRLQPIAKIRKQQERSAGRLHGESLRQAEQQKKQLDELISYRNHYAKSFQSAIELGLSVIQMQEYKLFINRLDEAITQQKQNVNYGQNRCEASQKEWLDKRSKSKMIDKVIESRQQTEQQEREKRDQRELDNIPHKAFTNL